ncbi:MAG: hypothetical protein RML72_07805 [Bacteroidia bacterium]|nr:hypothetical protein [Bacteroidia bacterium]MDW8158763.1 hypothetical protein [Bacteroidia bacterium]
MRIVFLFLLCVFHSWLLAQKSIRDSTIHFFYGQVVYKGCNPGADLATRFGFTSLIGAEVGYKFKNNIYIGAGGFFLFGEKVKEMQHLNHLAAPLPYGTIAFIANDGSLFLPIFEQRGYAIHLSTGYIWNRFRFSSHNPNSGIFIELGAQWLTHQIAISLPMGMEATYLNSNYRKGYDRLTSGVGIRQNVGYRYWGNKRFVNFFIGLEGSINFTQNQRSINFDTGKADTTLRTDILYGFSVGWALPIYKVAPEKYYYY